MNPLMDTCSMVASGAPVVRLGAKQEPLTTEQQLTALHKRIDVQVANMVAQHQALMVLQKRCVQLEAKLERCIAMLDFTSPNRDAAAYVRQAYENDGRRVAQGGLPAAVLGDHYGQPAQQELNYQHPPSSINSALPRPVATCLHCGQGTSFGQRCACSKD
jgi:hypothetical protein